MLAGVLLLLLLLLKKKATSPFVISLDCGFFGKFASVSRGFSLVVLKKRKKKNNFAKIAWTIEGAAKLNSTPKCNSFHQPISSGAPFSSYLFWKKKKGRKSFGGCFLRWPFSVVGVVCVIGEGESHLVHLWRCAGELPFWQKIKHLLGTYSIFAIGESLHSVSEQNPTQSLNTSGTYFRANSSFSGIKVAIFAIMRSPRKTAISHILYIVPQRLQRGARHTKAETGKQSFDPL